MMACWRKSLTEACIGDAELERSSRLGLAIFRSLVHAHRVRIWAEKRADGGAVFRVFLRAV